MKCNISNLMQDLKTIFYDDDNLHDIFYLKLQRSFEHIGEFQELKSSPETMTIFILSILYNHWEPLFEFMEMMEDCTELNERFSEEELNGKVSLDEIFDYGKAFGSNEPNEENDFLEELDTEKF